MSDDRRGLCSASLDEARSLMSVGPEPVEGSAANSESMFQPPKEYRVIDRVKRRRQIQGDQDVDLLGVNILEQIVSYSYTDCKYY